MSFLQWWDRLFDREPRPFRPQVFLYRMLGAIFFTEAMFLAFAFVKCSQPLPGNPVPLVNERCPKLGERTETLFVAAVATTLSLLTGAVATAEKMDKHKGEVKPPQAKVENSPPPQLPPQAKPSRTPPQNKGPQGPPDYAGRK